jgi:hypothetical protein
MYENLLANVPTDLWIGGQWRKASDGGRFDTTLAEFAILHEVVMWMQRSPVWFREVGICRCYRRELVHKYRARDC